MSNILNTGLDKETLSLCVALCESGINPDAIAMAIKELSKNEKVVGKLS